MLKFARKEVAPKAGVFFFFYPDRFSCSPYLSSHQWPTQYIEFCWSREWVSFERQPKDCSSLHCASLNNLMCYFYAAPGTVIEVARIILSFNIKSTRPTVLQLFLWNNYTLFGSSKLTWDQIKTISQQTVGRSAYNFVLCKTMTWNQ